MTKQPPAIVWFRSDLRLSDNAALAAVAGGQPVLPLYILDDESAGSWAMGGAARWWLHHSLQSLAADLEKLGAPLMLARGRATDIIPALMDETGAATVHAGHAHESWARAVETILAERLGDRLQLHRTATLFDLDAIKTGGGTPYGVYTPFAKACRARAAEIGEPLPAPTKLVGFKPPRTDALDDWALLPHKPDWAGGFRDIWQPGEAAAQTRLHDFMEATVTAYKTGRNLPGEDGTSRLSAPLHWGEISARQVWAVGRALPPGDGLDTFLGEILWREFSAYLLWHHPTMPEAPLRPAFEKLPFRDGKADFKAWTRGQTGVPIVDAGLRQLWQVGWMHNRVRMIAASFLVKNLLVDWREGEAWFWDTLVCADLASNAAGWQWIAGCGIDSQPFFRVFNPVSQGDTWDKAGDYVRQWVPEIAGLPDKYLHAPWTAPTAALVKAGITLGKTYPQPLVDLGESRQRALDTYRTTVRGVTA